MEVQENKKLEMPIWQKATLTLKEAAAFSNIGEDRIRILTNKDGCDFVLFVGNKRLIKRKKFEEFIDNTDSI